MTPDLLYYTFALIAAVAGSYAAGRSARKPQGPCKHERRVNELEKTLMIVEHQRNEAMEALRRCKDKGVVR